MADSDTVEDIDLALSILAFDQRRISDSERWTRYIDRLLDQRLELEPAS